MSSVSSSVISGLIHVAIGSDDPFWSEAINIELVAGDVAAFAERNGVVVAACAGVTGGADGIGNTLWFSADTGARICAEVGSSVDGGNSIFFVGLGAACPSFVDDESFPF